MGRVSFRFVSAVLLALIRAGHSGTGEHGVGLGKKEYLVDELGAGTVELMKTVKKAVDPLHILNPGKVRMPSSREKFDHPRSIALSGHDNAF